MDLLDHHQLQIAQHVAQILRFPTLPGGDIAEDRLFAEVKADHLRDVRIDRFVVSHPGADGVGQHYAAAR